MPDLVPFDTLGSVKTYERTQNLVPPPTVEAPLLKTRHPMSLPRVTQPFLNIVPPAPTMSSPPMGLPSMGLPSINLTKYVDPKRVYKRFEGCIQTKTTNGSKCGDFYLNMLDVFKYVTRGAGISDEYYEILNEYICNDVFGCSVDSLDSRYKMTEPRISFNGRTYNRVVVLYHWGNYGILASKIIQWAISNPEKISGFN